MLVSKLEEDRRGMKLVGSFWIFEQSLQIFLFFRDEYVGFVFRDCYGIVMVNIALKVIVIRFVYDKSIIQFVVFVEIFFSWIIVVIFVVSVCAVFLLFLGCIVLVWCIYVKIKYVFFSGNVFFQYLKEVGGRLELEVDEKILIGRVFLDVGSV